MLIFLGSMLLLISGCSTVSLSEEDKTQIKQAVTDAVKDAIKNQLNTKESE